MIAVYKFSNMRSSPKYSQSLEQIQLYLSLEQIHNLLNRFNSIYLSIYLFQNIHNLLNRFNSIYLSIS